jgi:hypothetical protein
MKKIDCIHYYAEIETYPRQIGENSFILEDELVDEICLLDVSEPKHHNEYSCERCSFYKKGVE